MTKRLLGSDEAIDFWNERHRTQGDLSSGGHVSADEASNAWFYATRLGKLLELMGDSSEREHPCFVLDAGCGKGHFARGVAACGHHVVGIDTSEVAIEQCRREGPGRYAVSTLHEWSSPWLYDVVYCIDVLFHVLDDELWRRSLVNLASLVRVGGSLIVADEFRDERVQRGDYIVHRPGDEYLDLLARHGMEFLEFVPYRYRDNRIGLAAFRRRA